MVDAFETLASQSQASVPKPQMKTVPALCIGPLGDTILGSEVYKVREPKIRWRLIPIWDGERVLERVDHDSSARYRTGFGQQWRCP